MLHARYTDGIRPVSHDVEVRPVAGGVEITFPANATKLVWRFDETHLEREDGEAKLFRMRHGSDTGERLTANQAVFEQAFARDMPAFNRGRDHNDSTRRIAIWSVAAIASLLLVFMVGLPLIARIGAPIIPFSWEVKLGEGVEPQILEMFGQGKAPKICGLKDGPGRKALDTLVKRLTAEARLPGALKVDVLDTPVTNAFALPGGRIFLFRPILDKAGGPDEVAGVLAHEIGHVINRDAMRAMIHDGALSLVVGMMLGDVTGGTTVAMLGKMMLGNAYSRENERDADKVSVRLMGQAGADPRAINAFFGRLRDLEGKDGGAISNAFRSHPITQERIERVEQLAGDAPRSRFTPSLDAGEWQALKAICAEGK